MWHIKDAGVLLGLIIFKLWVQCAAGDGSLCCLIHDAETSCETCLTRFTVSPAKLRSACRHCDWEHSDMLAAAPDCPKPEDLSWHFWNCVVQHWKKRKKKKKIALWWLFSKGVVVSCEKAVQGNMFLKPVIEGKSELITISAVVLTRFSFLLLQNKKKTPCPPPVCHTSNL